MYAVAAGTHDDTARPLLEAAEQLAQVGHWEWIPAEQTLLWSENLFRIFGLEPGELVPTPGYVFDRTRPDDVDRVAQAVAGLAETGELSPLPYRIFREDRVVRHLRATLTVTEWRGAEPHRVVGWVQDVTEQRRAEREIAAHYAVAEALAGWRSLEQGGADLLANLADAMDFAAGVLWVPRGGLLRARVVWLARSLEGSDLESITRHARLPRGSGIAGRAWERREPISDVGHAVTPRRQAAARAGLRGGVAIPAISAEEVLAVIELGSREEAELTPRLMQSLTGIGYEPGQFLSRRRGELDAPGDHPARDRGAAARGAGPLGAPHRRAARRQPGDRAHALRERLPGARRPRQGVRGARPRPDPPGRP